MPRATLMVKCEITWNEIPKRDAVEVDELCWSKRYVHKDYKECWAKCDDCLEIYNAEDEWQEVYWWSTVCQKCLDENYTLCYDCDNYKPSDSCSYYDWVNRVLCDGCVNDNYRECNECWNYYEIGDMHTWDDDEYYCEECIGWHIDDDNGNWEWEYKDWVIQTTNTNGDLPKQTPYACPEKLQKRLREFYSSWRDIKDQNLHKRKDVKLEWVVALKSYLALKLFNHRKKWWNMSLSSIYYNAFKYNKTEPVACDWVQITYSYVDIMGKKKERTESIMSIYEYYKKMCWDKFDRLKPNKDEFIKESFNVVLDNNLDHKLALACENDNAFHSCQTSDNVDCYSRGMRDWFNNDCNIPIAIMVWKKIVGRQLCRLMIDWKWNEYLFLDRLYLNDRYWDYKKFLYVEIAKRLRKHFALAIPTHSQHDKPISDYLYDDFNKDRNQDWVSLRQPLRWYLDIHRWYYHDSFTQTRETGWMLYDKIAKDLYVYTLPKK